ncbi:MAG: bifunctional phosphoserine phosphatase/homoserine phosphotransferase ThrH [Nitrospira sp. SB0675_bin_23]|nr:bifunctional phosphoserine phosphatase/homoserine phosphotransferase ThrH [Nitrospira sp. SB0667_bin_9]MYD30581.1 bifunctional phosphoserine phosphatase/homoserine phosphotransferase ThrH [Nitrospira sp. SB0661_bin_20]MYH02943.1 bifunctional phosphoserine phosphatase/homoserine phosphotransferase ThrH [Nitrospira sp. SB0675_bin_23]
MKSPVVTCLDMEGVLTPEIWLALAEKTGITDLNVTTRDIPDYDELMKLRLGILAKFDLKLSDVTEVVAGLKPLDGAVEFLTWLRERCQVIILSDSYYDLVSPLMKQLHYPSIFCHTLEIDDKGYIRNYALRQQDQKRHAVAAVKNLNFHVLAAGDSYNDLSMLQEADAGFFFRPPDSICSEYPQFPVTRSYPELMEHFASAGGFSH